MERLITLLREWLNRLFRRRGLEEQKPEPIDYKLDDADNWEFCNQQAKEI